MRWMAEEKAFSDKDQRTTDCRRPTAVPCTHADHRRPTTAATQNFIAALVLGGRAPTARGVRPGAGARRAQIDQNACAPCKPSQHHCRRCRRSASRSLACTPAAGRALQVHCPPAARSLHASRAQFTAWPRRSAVRGAGHHDGAQAPQLRCIASSQSRSSRRAPAASASPPRHTTRPGTPCPRPACASPAGAGQAGEDAEGGMERRRVRRRPAGTTTRRLPAWLPGRKPRPSASHARPPTFSFQLNRLLSFSCRCSSAFCRRSASACWTALRASSAAGGRQGGGAGQAPA